jgi:general stress protein CsbA
LNYSPFYGDYWAGETAIDRYVAVILPVVLIAAAPSQPREFGLDAYFA